MLFHSSCPCMSGLNTVLESAQLVAIDVRFYVFVKVIT